MKLTVVGCSGSLPGPDSAASCYLLEAPYEDGVFRLLLDLGSGAIGALQRYVDLRSIGAVAFSHLHADHCLDLCGFYVMRKHHPDGHWGRIPVYGPPGVARRMASAYDISPDPGMTYIARRSDQSRAPPASRYWAWYEPSSLDRAMTR